MQQVLKLEHAYSEYEKLGSKLSDDLKTAVLMRSVTGQLKTWLQLQVNEGTTYAKVREMILMYDTSTTRWSEQMVLCKTLCSLLVLWMTRTNQEDVSAVQFHFAWHESHAQGFHLRPISA